MAKTNQFVHLDMNKNEIQNASFHNLSNAPLNPVVGQFYNNTTDDNVYKWNGTEWVSIGVKGAMVYKGTVGVGGTVTQLPKTGVQVGDTYKVCSDGTYEGHQAIIGDTLICLTREDPAGAVTPTTDPTWTLIPSGTDKKVATIEGDGTTTAFVLNHTLNSKDVNVSVYDSNDQKVITAVEITSATSVTVSFNVAPAVNENFTVVITQ